MAEQDKPTAASETKSGMPQADVDFLVACLRNTTGGSIAIDTKAVAEALKYQNHRSVGNRISALKKKYNLPFGASSTGKSKASDTTDTNEPAVPVTPHKSRVTKTKTPVSGSARKKATPKKKFKKEESEDEETITSIASSITEFAVKNPSVDLSAPLGEDQAHFGTGDEDNGEEQERFDEA